MCASRLVTTTVFKLSRTQTLTHTEAFSTCRLVGKAVSCDLVLWDYNTKFGVTYLRRTCTSTSSIGLRRKRLTTTYMHCTFRKERRGFLNTGC